MYGSLNIQTPTKKIKPLPKKMEGKQIEKNKFSFVL